LLEVAAIAASSLFSQLDRYVRRIFRLLAVLVEMHLDIAQQEAAREQQRLATGLAFLVAGAGLLAMGFGMLQVAAVWLCHVWGLSWLASISIVGGADLLVGLVLLNAGSNKLRGAYMVETRDRIARTTVALTRDDGDSS